ncbi:MAG: EamA family transporter [Lachnospiraceae bacterium]|nr:EamA family transporter [Lachnospiraceae bacterium]
MNDQSFLNRHKYILGAALSVLGGAMWGISGTCGQFLFTRKGVSSLWLTPIRLFLAGIILLVWCFAQDARETVKPWKDKRDCIDLLIYGLAGITLCQFLYFGTIQLSSAGVATILQDLSPISILLCSCIAAKRSPKKKEIISILLALFGVFLLVTHGSLTDFAVSPLALLVGIGSAGAVTVYNVYPKRLLSRYPVYILQGWSFFVGGSISMLVFRPWNYQVVLDWQILLGILTVVIAGNLLAFNSYMVGVRLIGPEKAILYGFAEPVAAAVLSSLWLGAPFTLWDFAGFVCVFVMLFLLSIKGNEAASQKCE